MNQSRTHPLPVSISFLVHPRIMELIPLNKGRFTSIYLQLHLFPFRLQRVASPDYPRDSNSFSFGAIYNSRNQRRRVRTRGCREVKEFCGKEIPD
ncbi:hypothetical protein LINGRAHAP2_LOCUS560, partial [Linum grandiflorum]